MLVTMWHATRLWFVMQIQRLPNFQASSTFRVPFRQLDVQLGVSGQSLLLAMSNRSFGKARFQSPWLEHKGSPIFCRTSWRDHPDGTHENRKSAGLTDAQRYQ